jgi:hypothetical protein
MVADLVALLEREQAHLMRLDGVAFMRRLPAYIAAITDMAAVSEILDGMEAEAQGALDEYVDTTNGLMQQAVALRDQLVAREPGSDDSSAPEPEDEATHAYSDFMFTLAHFNQLNETTVKVTYPKLPSDQVEDKPLPEMLNILRGKVHLLQFGEGPDPNRRNQRPDLDDLKIELINLVEQQDHVVRKFADASKTLPGVAFKRLQLFADRLNPETVVLAPDASLAERADRLLGYWWTPESSVHKALSGARLDDYDERRFESIVSDLKAQADLVHTELVGRHRALPRGARAFQGLRVIREPRNRSTKRVRGTRQAVS